MPGMNLRDRTLRRAVKKVHRCSGHYVLDGRVPELEVSRIARKRHDVIHDWVYAVSRRPHLWLVHRFEMATCLLRIGYDPGGKMHGISLVSRGHHGAGADAVPRADKSARDEFAPWHELIWDDARLAFMPITWLAVFLIAARFALHRVRTRPIVRAFVVGNLLYLLSNFVFAPAPNLRYVFPIVPSAVALCLVAVGRHAPTRAERRRGGDRTARAHCGAANTT